MVVGDVVNVKGRVVKAKDVDGELLLSNYHCLHKEIEVLITEGKVIEVKDLALHGDPSSQALHPSHGPPQLFFFYQSSVVHINDVCLTTVLIVFFRSSTVIADLIKVTVDT